MTVRCSWLVSNLILGQRSGYQLTARACWSQLIWMRPLQYWPEMLFRHVLLACSMHPCIQVSHITYQMHISNVQRLLVSHIVCIWARWRCYLYWGREVASDFIERESRGIAEPAVLVYWLAALFLVRKSSICELMARQALPRCLLRSCCHRGSASPTTCSRSSFLPANRHHNL